MAVRTQIRLPQLSGSIDDSGSALTQMSGDSLQSPLDAMGAAIRRINGGGDFFRQSDGVFTHSLMKVTGACDLTGDLTVQGNDIYGSYVTGEPVKALTLNSGSIVVNGDVTVGGNDIKDSGGNDHIKFTAGVGGLTEIVGDLKLSGLDIQNDKGVASITMGTQAADVTVNLGAGLGLVSTAADLKIGGGDIQNANGVSAVQLATGATNVAVGLGAGNGLVTTVADLKVGGNDIQNSQGVNSITLGTHATNVDVSVTAGTGKLKVLGNNIQGSNGVDMITFTSTAGSTEVIIPGDLTVKGTTTSIDTTNLEVEDTFIGLNFTSGSEQGGAKDVGIIMGQASGGDNPSMVAMYFDQSEDRFKYVSTVNNPSGSIVNLVDAGFKDLEVADLWVQGLNIKNESADAMTLTAGASPDVSFSNNIGLADSKKIQLGNAAGGDAQLWHDPTGDGTLNLDVAAGQKFAFAIDAAITAIVTSSNGQGTLKLCSAGAFGGILSSSDGGDLRLHSAKDLHLSDIYRQSSTWSLVDGIKLATNASDWSAFETAFGEVSLLAAIKAAKDTSATGAGKTTFFVPPAGVALSGSVNININLDGMATADVVSRVDLFVNGQLMLSNSLGEGDYQLAAPTAATDVTIFFPLVDQDVVTAIVR